MPDLSSANPGHPSSQPLQPSQPKPQTVGTALVPSTAQYQAAIGQRAQAYYLRQFQALDESRRPAPHLPALCFTFSWLVYRRMWRWAAAYLALQLLALWQLAALSGDAAPAAFIACTGIFFQLPSLAANHLYHWHCKKLIARSAGSDSPAMSLARLNKRGGTTSALAAAVASVLLLMAWAAAMAVDVHQRYYEQVSVREALRVAQNAQSAVRTFSLSHGRRPATLAEAGFDPGKLPAHLSGIARLSYEASSGAITVDLAQTESGQLRTLPNPNLQDEAAGLCETIGLPAHLVPKPCTGR